MGDLIPLVAILAALIGLPWLIFHYITQWKKNGSLTLEDERMLDDLNDIARRLDDRMQTIERIMTAENPGWRQLTADHASTGIEDINIRTNRRIEQ